MNTKICRQIFGKSLYFIKIHPFGPEFFHADGRADRHDEAYSRFRPVKQFILTITVPTSKNIANGRI